MKGLRLAAAAAVAVAGTVVASVTVLAPSTAQAYPGLTCTISDVEVVGGEDATVTATVDPAVESDFVLNYQGQTHTENGVTSTTATFETDEVDEETETRVFGTVTQNGNTSECTGGTITLLPEDDDGDGDGDGDGGGLLPDTGGERLTWLLIGALLVVVGGGVVLTSRRRRA